jgi:hypothetical protein
MVIGTILLIVASTIGCLATAYVDVATLSAYHGKCMRVSCWVIGTLFGISIISIIMMMKLEMPRTTKYQ